jgi:hypothetical protein
VLNTNRALTLRYWKQDVRQKLFIEDSFQTTTVLYLAKFLIWVIKWRTKIENRRNKMQNKKLYLFLMFDMTQHIVLYITHYVLYDETYCVCSTSLIMLLFYMTKHMVCVLHHSLCYCSIRRNIVFHINHFVLVLYDETYCVLHNTFCSCSIWRSILCSTMYIAHYVLVLYDETYCVLHSSFCSCSTWRNILCST